MAVIHFRDRHGKRGVITDSLEVRYDGAWQSEVEECLRRVSAESGTDGAAEEDPGVYTRLVLVLPEDSPIVEIERIDDPPAATSLEGTGR